jgi:hypothetical protein
VGSVGSTHSSHCAEYPSLLLGHCYHPSSAPLYELGGSQSCIALPLTLLMCLRRLESFDPGPFQTVGYRALELLIS